MSEAPDTSSTVGDRLRGGLRRYGPWALAAGLIVWITGRVSWADAWNAAQDAELGLFAGAIGLAALFWFALDSLGFSILFTRFNAPVSWAEARSVRALTYLLTPINWNLGTAAVVLHLRQSKGVPATASAGSMMLYGMVDGIVIVGMLGIGLAFVSGDHGMGAALPGVLAFVTAQTAFFGLVMADRPKWGWLDRVRGSSLMESYRKANKRDMATLLAVRTAYFIGFVGLFVFGSRAFGIQLPVPFAAMSMPLVMGAAMFTPAGVGGQQAVMLALYEPYGTEPAILAFAVAFPVGLILARIAIGLFYIRDLRAFRDGQRAARASEA